jgi:hypothetical protein
MVFTSREIAYVYHKQVALERISTQRQRNTLMRNLVYQHLYFKGQLQVAEYLLGGFHNENRDSS